ncbi:Phosphotransferase enzyme family protein [compost metagenome]
MSHGRAQEFALLKAAFAAGVTVPEPLWLCSAAQVIGRPFFVMRKVGGLAAGHAVVKDTSLGGDRAALTFRLGVELARIHSIRPPRADLDFLPTYDQSPALQAIERYRAFLDQHHSAHPALEWGLRWLERHAPPRGEIVLAHRDFRTGNYMVDAHGLTAILDWEFAGWSDPLEDIGWFCAKCWRFGVPQLEAGGIGTRSDFYRASALLGGHGPSQLGDHRHPAGAAACLRRRKLVAAGTDRPYRAGAGIRNPVHDGGSLMREQPRGEDLLASAEALLRDELLPALPAEKRHAGLMIARALGIAARQLQNGEAPERQELASLARLLATNHETNEPEALRQLLQRANRQLGQLIRSGAADAGENRTQVVQHLLRIARQRVAESNPRYLADSRQ